MKKILILGGGYAGVSTAIHLKDVDAQVTLVNKHSYHHLTTLLHQPVVGRRNYQDLSVGLTSILPPPVKFIRGTVESIRTAEQRVNVKVRGKIIDLDYDILVIALGWEPQFFSIPGLKENALTLHSLNTSRLAKDRIEEALIAYDENPDERWRATIVIGGGGLSGIELAGELIDSRKLMAKSVDISPGEIKIILVEGAPTLLPGLDPWLAETSERYLKAKGVQCLTNTRITNMQDHTLTLSDGVTIQAGAVLWTGGIRGNALLEKNGFSVDRQGRVETNEFLQTKDPSNIFVTGDCALTTDVHGKPFPPTAWLAVQQGRHTALNIRRLLAGNTLLPYVAEAKALVLSLGRRYAVGIVAGHRISGKTAAILKDALAYKYLYDIGGIRLAWQKFWEWAPYLVLMHRD